MPPNNEISGQIGDFIEEVEEASITKSKQKVGLYTFISMIFVTVYGLQNGQQIFYQMGYASITYVVIGILTFFVPYAFFISEMGSAFHQEKGGIFSWMAKSVGIRFSATGAFLWYISAIIWWFALSSVSISISTAIFGVDVSETWHLFGLSNTLTTAFIGMAVFCIVILFCRRGVKQVGFLANIAMIVAIFLHIVVLGGGILVFALHGGHFEQGFNFTKVSSYFYGPNKAYDNPLAAIGFMAFAVFILGGMEGAGGLVDKIEHPKTNVPKGMLFAAVIIAILYVVVVLVTGMVINWHTTLSNSNVNLFNYGIYMVLQQFTELGTELGFSPAHAVELGKWVNRVLSWTTLLAMFNLPLMLYYPIKQVFEGLPDGMVPKFLMKRNKYGVTANALYFQSAIVLGAMFCLGAFSAVANQVYNNLTYMVTLAMIIPWMFIVFAYIKFKLNDDIKKEYTFFSKKWGVIVGCITLFTIFYAVAFSIVQPFMQGYVERGVLMVVGPAIFCTLGLLFGQVYVMRHKHGNLPNS